MSWYRRYGTAVLLVLASLLFRLALQPWLGLKVPYLQFFPAIMLAAWFGGFGPGVAATILSSAAGVFFFVAPAGSVAVPETSDLISLGLFVATGLGISWFNHRLRDAESALHEAAAEARAHAQELDTVLNTTVDGIIVIDAAGRVETFNRGAERLFGYPRSEVIGRNVSLLMPSPDHEQHDGYLARYLSTGQARIIGAGREVTGRRRDGTFVPLHLSVGEMTIGGQRKFTGMLHDLSGRVQARRASPRERGPLAVRHRLGGRRASSSSMRTDASRPSTRRPSGCSDTRRARSSARTSPGSCRRRTVRSTTPTSRAISPRA